MSQRSFNGDCELCGTHVTDVGTVTATYYLCDECVDTDEGDALIDEHYARVELALVSGGVVAEALS